MSKATRDKRTFKNLNYLAGFFDGEGSIFIAKINNKKSGNVWYRLTASCGNSDRRPIDMLRKFNPNLKSFIYRSGRKESYKPCYQWLATGNTALNFLEILKDRLIVKKKQAFIGIEFQKWRNSLKNDGKPRSKEIMDKCEKYRLKIKNLNLKVYLQSQRLSEETLKKSEAIV